MDKEKDFAKAMFKARDGVKGCPYPDIHCPYGIQVKRKFTCIECKSAHILAKQGYGNIKQAVKDFAEICKKKAEMYGITAQEIDKLIKEIYPDKS